MERNVMVWTHCVKNGTGQITFYHGTSLSHRLDQKSSTKEMDNSLKEENKMIYSRMIKKQ